MLIATVSYSKFETHSPATGIVSIEN